MTTPIHEQLDTLHVKVNQLVNHLISAKQQHSQIQQQMQQQLDSLILENQNLKNTLDQSSQKINQILEQWFPELTE
jgi:hypothetical protein